MLFQKESRLSVVPKSKTEVPIPLCLLPMWYLPIVFRAAESSDQVVEHTIITFYEYLLHLVGTGGGQENLRFHKIAAVVIIILVVLQNQQYRLVAVYPPLPVAGVLSDVAALPHIA